MRIGFNEGSLLRRTLLHVVTFVVGSIAIVAFASFTLVSIAKGFVKPSDASAEPAKASDKSDRGDSKDDASEAPSSSPRPMHDSPPPAAMGRGRGPRFGRGRGAQAEPRNE